MKKQMVTTKRLALHRETLRALEGERMRDVNGGATLNVSACNSACSVCISCRATLCC